MRRNQLAACFTAMLVLLGSLLVEGAPANALSGNCAATSNYFSVVCVQGSYPYTGIYGKWNASTALNISQYAAQQQGMFISEVHWIYDLTTPSSPTWLEVGDTAGGGRIINHVNEWARMWYYTDGTRGSLNELDYFYQYAPADGINHSFGLQWNGSTWDVCFDAPCPAHFGWNNPLGRTTTEVSSGLEVSGKLALNVSNTNSGLFNLNTMLLRNTNAQWLTWPAALKQVDQSCGTVPCLQGYWLSGPPPYDNWQNAQPAQ